MWVGGGQEYDPNSQFNKDMELRDAVTQGKSYHYVRQLIDNGAKVNSQQNANSMLGNLTPPLLHMAVRRGKPSVMEVLVGADLDNKDIRDMHGRTALHVAALEGNTDCATILMQLGLKADALDNHGFSTSDLAYARGHTEIVKSMRSNGYACEEPADMDELRANVAAVYPLRQRSHAQQHSRKNQGGHDGPSFPIR